MTTVTTEISPRRIADLFVTAIESGDPVTTAKRGGWCEGIYLESPGDVAPGDPHKGPWYDNPRRYEDPELRLKIVEVSDERTGATTDHFVEHQSWTPTIDRWKSFTWTVLRWEAVR